MANLIGQSLGRYQILEQLGEGGMAIVYKAMDTRLDSFVAVKVIRTERLIPEIAEKTIKRFEREAKALAQLTHPNIVKVIDYGDFENHPYLVMEYLAGGTLKEKLGKQVPWQESARLLVPIAQALEYAHKHNFIHRDVKPSNILLTEEGQPMLSDFGIAKILDEEATVDLTGTRTTVGTPEYMSPEQGLGKPIDFRTDVYALGVVLYELVTGRKPYVADTPLETLFKHVSEPLPPPGRFVRDLPEAVEQALVRALAKNPADRYHTMAAFAAALEEIDLAGRKPGSTQPAAPRSTKEDDARTVDQDALPSPAPGEETRKTGVRKTRSAVGSSGTQAAPKPAHKPAHETIGKVRAILAGHTDWVSSIAISPDNTLLASGSYDSTVRLWRFPDGILAKRLEGIQAAVLGLAFSPDGNTLAAGLQNKQIRLWNAPVFSQFKAFKKHRDFVWDVAFSPDGSLLASCSDDHTIALWNTGDLSPAHLLMEHTDGIMSVCFNPEGTILASASADCDVMLWQVSTGMRIRILDKHDDFVERVVFSPDGRLLASASDDRTIRLWSIPEGEPVKVLEGHDLAATSIAFSPDGSLLASGSDDQSIVLWDTETWSMLGRLKGHTREVNSLLFSQDSRILVSCSDDNTVILWDLIEE